MDERQDPAVTLSLAPGMQMRLDRIARRLGVPLPQLAAHALEYWVAEQERSIALIEALAEDVGGEMGPRLKDMLLAGLFSRQQNLASPALRESEVTAIAEQQGLSTSAAAGLGSALLRSPSGVRQLERMMSDQIEHAREAGDLEKAEALEATLSGFRQG